MVAPYWFTDEGKRLAYENLCQLMDLPENASPGMISPMLQMYLRWADTAEEREVRVVEIYDCVKNTVETESGVPPVIAYLPDMLVEVLGEPE